MGGRAVEGTGLENRQGCKLLVGSNPTPSASPPSTPVHICHRRSQRHWVYPVAPLYIYPHLTVVIHGYMMGKTMGKRADGTPKKAAGLTARQVQTQKAAGLFADGGGLYLQVAPTGAKTWIFRFQLAGRRRDMGLGSASIFSLAEAREKAAAARRLVAERVDPIEQRARRAAAATLEQTKVMTFR